MNLATCCRNMDRKIPIYAGCKRGMIVAKGWAPGWPGHGKDGLGDSKNLMRDNLATPEKEHAAVAMVNLIRENPHEVELLMVGPLSNLAMAIRLEPELPSLIKKVWIMGGTS